MATALTYFGGAASAALLFILLNRAVGRKVGARARFLLGALLALTLILPLRMPVVRFEVPSEAAESFFGEAVAEEPSADLPPQEEQSENGQTQKADESEHSFPIKAVALAVYAIGVAVTLFCIFYQYCRDVKDLLRCGRAPSAQESEMFSRLCRKHGIRKEPTLLVCPAASVGSSLTFGFIRQKVLLSERFEKEDAELILEHELTHCKRRDTVLKALLSLLCALHWFDPIIYAFAREMDFLCEQACDEKLLKNSGNEEKARYCKLLVKTALSISAEKKFLISAFKGGKNFMKQRITNILNKKSKLLAVVMAVAVVFIALLTSAIYITTPPENIKVAYFTEPQGLYDYNKKKTTIDEYVCNNHYAIKYAYSVDSDEVKISGIVNGEEFNIKATFAGPSYNGGRIAYIGDDSNGNYDVKYVGFQFSQTVEYNELPLQDHDAGERGRHKFSGWFSDYAKENTQYKNVLQVALNPIDTDDIIIIEIFLEDDFITEYITKNNIKCVDETIIGNCEDWCMYWIVEHGVKKN